MEEGRPGEGGEAGRWRGGWVVEGSSGREGEAERRM